MGIYSKKRKNLGFRFVIYSIFLLSIILILGYYFFYPNNLNTIPDENPLETIIEVSDLDRKIKDFIQNNPDFIIDVLRKYQDEQSKVEQDKISSQNKSNISSLNLFDNPMIIGNSNASKIIF